MVGSVPMRRHFIHNFRTRRRKSTTVLILLPAKMTNYKDSKASRKQKRCQAIISKEIGIDSSDEPTKVIPSINFKHKYYKFPIKVHSTLQCWIVNRSTGREVTLRSLEDMFHI